MGSRENAQPHRMGGYANDMYECLGQKDCPRAGKQRGRDERGSVSHIMTDAWAVCKLRGTRIIDALPPGCPLAAARAFGAMLALRERAFAMASAPSPDGTREAFARADACQDCCPDLLKHPRIQQLRAAALAKAPQPATGRAIHKSPLRFPRPRRGRIAYVS